MSDEPQVGRIRSVAVGDRPGLRKRPVDEGRLEADFGMQGDRHAGRGPRQISLLDAAVADAMRDQGMAVGPGDLGENVQIAGLALEALTPGARLRIGDAVLEITQTRPACRSVREVDPRALKALVGHSGQMARVVRSGTVRPGDTVELISSAPGGR